MLQALFVLRIYNYLESFIGQCSKNIGCLYTGLYGAFRVKTHLFFEDISTPYDKLSVNIGTPSSAIPQWYYRSDTKTFVEWSLEFQTMDDAMQSLTAENIPILSMAVVDEERVIHDLTDFLETVRVFHSASKFPSIAHIIGAWSLASGIVLNTRKEYYVNIITNTADMIAMPIESHEYYSDTPPAVVQESAVVE